MENLIFFLIDLVFDNVFILAILFGVVSFIFNKLKGAGGTGAPQRPNSMPPFGGGMSRGEPAPDVLRPEVEVESTRPRQTVSTNTLEPARSAPYSDVPEATITRERTQELAPLEWGSSVEASEVFEATRPVQRTSANAAPRTATGESSFTARHAAQGMMWAEVFGPPRARKNHMTRRRP